MTALAAWAITAMAFAYNQADRCEMLENAVESLDAECESLRADNQKLRDQLGEP